MISKWQNKLYKHRGGFASPKYLKNIFQKNAKTVKSTNFVFKFSKAEKFVDFP